MSVESLEDGEIASEAEPTPEPKSPDDLNDEILIDQIVQKENVQNSSAQRIQSPEPTRRRSRNDRRRLQQRQQQQQQQQQQQNIATSWHNTNGSGTSNGGRQNNMRPSPSEAVIFGMPQNNHYDFYPPGISRPSLHYFPAPPTALMSIPFHPNQMMHPPPPPPPNLHNFQPISPTPLPATFDDNYEQVSMDMVSPDEPQTSAAEPPREIPLEVVQAPPKAQFEDEEALRALLLSQMSQKKKRGAEKSSQKSPPKRQRKNSTRFSSSVVNAFVDHKPITPPAPIPKIAVNISTTTTTVLAAPAIPPTVAQNPEESQESPESPSPSPKQVEPEPLTREAKRAQLELKMSEINKIFEEQRKKVESAGRNVKTAAIMAKRAAEMAKEAEEMNRQAMEMRQKCIEDSKSGKEEMKKILVEKRDIQNAIDLMSIDDMEEIDMEEFEEIVITAVKRESKKLEEPIRDPKEEPPVTAENSFVAPPDNSMRETAGKDDVFEEEMVQETANLDISEIMSREEPEDQQDEESEDEEVEGEDEYEEEEEGEEEPIVQEPVQVSVQVTAKESVKKPLAVQVTSNIELQKENGVVVKNGHNSKENGVKPKESALEQVLRQRLMKKMTRPEKSPVPIVSSSSASDSAQECRNVLYNMCKFELNGKCERPRDCSFIHLHSINDRKQQEQLLEGLFRDVFHYKEADIATAVQQMMYFLPEFRQFEKLMEQFFKSVIHQTPNYKHKLFHFFANRR